MKTLFFCNLIPLKSGAFETVLAAIGAEFRKNGNEFVVVFAGTPIQPVAKALIVSGVRWHILKEWTDGPGRERAWRFVVPALRLLRQERPDVAVVHFGNELPSLVTAVLAHAMGQWRTRWVWQQDQQIFDPNWVTSRVSKIRLLGLVFDRFLATYDAGKESLMKRGLSSGKISVIYNSLSDHIPVRPKGWLRRELGVGADDVILVTVGSLIPRKRIDFILRAFGELKKNKQEAIGKMFVQGATRTVDITAGSKGESHSIGSSAHIPESVCWRFLVIGEGMEREPLRCLAEKCGIAGRVHFMGLRNDVRDILDESDVLLHASHAEACTYAISESMSAGIPAVVTEAGAAKEQIVNGVTGWILAPDDEQGFVNKVAMLVDDERMRHEMGRRARERWQIRYRLENAAKQFHELYASLS
jgi:glycosyltransferase involved in cell wall biosynthesis